MKEIGISQWPYEYLKVKKHLAKVTWCLLPCFGAVCVCLGAVNVQVELQNREFRSVEQLSMFVVALTVSQPYALCSMLSKHLFL